MTLAEVKKKIDLLPPSRRQIAKAIYEKAVWQNRQLTNLQKIITEKGWVEDYRNGEHQSGRKKSAEADTYLSLAKIFNSTMKQLNDMIGAEGETNKDEFMEFVMHR